MRPVADHPRREVRAPPGSRAAWSCSQSATVASMPLAGDAVTETVARRRQERGLVDERS